MENAELEESGETQDSPAGESQSHDPAPVQLRELASILAQGQPSDDATPEDVSPGESQAAPEGEETGESQAPPKTLSEAAERLGLDVAELYKLQIPDAHREGETHTLGELKNAADKQSEIAVSQLAWEESRSKQQAELLRAQQEMEELISLLPKRALESDALSAVRNKLDARAAREREQTKAVLGWQSEDKASQELEGMVEFMRGFGFPTEYLKTVTDHRWFHLVREAWAREKRMNDALAQVERMQKQPARPNKRQTRLQKLPENSGRKSPSAKREELVDLLQPTRG